MRLIIKTARAQDPVPKLLASLVIALFLTGCGASLSDTAQSGLAPGLAPADAAAKTQVSTSGATQASFKQTPAISSASPAGAVADKFTSAATPGSNAYKIGPLDVLDVSVFKVPDLSKSVQVADSGSINLPLVGEIQAAGKTAQDIERDLTSKLGAKYLQSPQVTVFVKEYNSQRVTIEGSVKRPGVYPIKGKSSLLQFIATAEGFDANSDSSVLVFRTTDGKRTAAKFEVSEIRAGNVQDPTIQSGDVIVASSSAMKETINGLLKLIPAVGMFAAL
jgi:polysaccharide biosynthesis/export protein